VTADTAVVTEHSTDASRAAAGTVALAVLQTLGRVLALVFVVVATREVLPAEFGKYSIVAGLVAFAGFVADFGSTTVITRVVSRDPISSDDLLAETLPASVLVGAFAYVGIIAYVALGPYSHDVVVFAAIGGLAIPFDAALSSMLAALDGHGLISRRALITFVRLAVIAGGGTLAVLATGEVAPAIVAVGLGPFVGLTMAAVLLSRHDVWRLRVRPKWHASVALFRAALPYALLGGIGAIVARLDLLVLSWFSSTAEVANYDLGLRGTEAATTLGMVIGGPTLYILSRRLGLHDLDGARRAYSHAIRIGYLIGLPTTAVIVALHEPLTRLAFGPQYTHAASLVAILGSSVWLAVLGWVQGSVVLAGGSTSRALRASLVLLACAATLDLALIPNFGASGAAIASVGASVVACCVFDFLNRETLGIRTPTPSIALVLSCVVSGAVMLVLTGVEPDWIGLLALPLLPAMLLGTGVVKWYDVRALIRLVIQGSRA
jgi:O-antigen/teichoic acid export membrane protein